MQVGFRLARVPFIDYDFSLQRGFKRAIFEYTTPSNRFLLQNETCEAVHTSPVEAAAQDSFA